jgi:hypothetical protein
MRHARTALLLVAIALNGCNSHPSPQPLGRGITAEPARLTPAPAPTGDPPNERHGTIPQAQASKQNTPAAGADGATPEAALRRYALAYTNWQAANLPAHEHELAMLAIGAARLAAEQTTASTSAIDELAADHVQNKGVILAITEGQGPARGQWIIVTLEQTTGSGVYAGLPPSPHITFARTTRLHGRWVVSSWTPQT